jgi:hypothetical protein
MSVKSNTYRPLECIAVFVRSGAADRDDQELKEKLAPIFGIKPEQITGEGCIRSCIFSVR